MTRPADAFALIPDLFHPAVTSSEPIALPALTLERFAEVKAKVDEFSKSPALQQPKGADVKVLPLGTGSAVPTLYRNGTYESLVVLPCSHLVICCSLVDSDTDPELWIDPVGCRRRHLGPTRPPLWVRGIVDP